MILPRVSVLTITHNHGRFLRECVGSVQAQTFPNWEQVVLDDGSTDGTQTVACSFKDPRIRYFRQEPRGVFRLGDTYNAALARARAPLVAILEGDDAWHPDLLTRLLPVFDDPEVVLSYSRIAAIIGSETRPISQPVFDSWPDKLRRNDPVGSALGPLLQFEGAPGTTSWVIRRSTLDSIGGFQQDDRLPLTDYPTLLHLARHGRFAPIDSTLAYWRKHAAQTTNVHSGAVFIGCADYALEFFDSLPEDVRSALNLPRARLIARLRRQRAFGCFRDGRHRLIAGEWATARASFRQAWAGGSLYVKVASAAGIAASYARTNLEFPARLARKEWYPPTSPP